MNNKLTMYMVTHKDVTYVPNDRTPIFVGNRDNKSDYIRDNVGENIADKNANYCELTAYYWIWKNDSESKYISIEHYRRFFMKKTLFPSPYKRKEMLDDLEKFDAVLIRKSESTLSIKNYYEKIHSKEDLELAEKAIEIFYPDYIGDYNRFINSNKSSLFNMCAMSKRSFDKYCEWLFKILFYVEKNTHLEGRSPYQQRAFGFLAERLLNVWVEHNLKNIKYLNVYYFEKNKIYSMLKSLKHEKKGKPYNPVALG